MSTPAEEKGYVIGQKFWYIGDPDNLPPAFDADEPIYLHDDDNTHAPEFRSVESDSDIPRDEDDNLDIDYISYVELDDVIPCQAGKTPCDILGYEVGDSFRLNEGTSDFEEGDIIYLSSDDGTPRPRFIKKDDDGDEMGYEYISLCFVEKVDVESIPKPKAELGGKVSALKGNYEVGEKFIITNNEPLGKDPHHWPIGAIVTLETQHPDTRSRFVYHSEDNGGKPTRHHAQSVSADCIIQLKQKGEYSVRLDAVGDNKVAAIKAVRSITNLGLRESKDLVEGTLPVFLAEDINIDFAQYCIRLIEYSGGKGTIGVGGLISMPTTSGRKVSGVICDELQAESQGSKQMIYFIDGESHEVTLVGYFNGSPVIVLVDRWGDPQPIIAKASLLTPKE